MENKSLVGKTKAVSEVLKRVIGRRGEGLADEEEETLLRGQVQQLANGQCEPGNVTRRVHCVPEKRMMGISETD